MSDVSPLQVAQLNQTLERLCRVLETFIEIWESEIARRRAIEKRHEEALREKAAT